VIGRGVILSAGAYVGDGAVIGDGTLLYAHAVVEHHCEIGQRCILHPGCVIGADGFGNAFAGDHWEKIPQIGRVLIGNDVEIGANTTVDRGALGDTVIEDGVRLDNLIHIAHNCRIGKHTAMAACVGVAGSTRIGAYCLMGGAAMISGHLDIGDRVQVSGGTLVAKSIRSPGVYTAVYPLAEHRDWLTNAARVRQIGSLFDRMKALEHELDALKRRDGSGE
ncbi:MAG: UDP-3-O-(3-hydroxymyristoyl)glucosamine N-acyltransferase, partial [Microvirgula sp.]